MQIPADDLLKQAKELLDKGEKLDVALDYLQRLFDLTLEGYPHQDLIIFYIATIHMKLEHNAMAITLYLKAIEANPDFIEAINNLGYVYKRIGRLDQAKSCFEDVIGKMNKYLDIIPISDQADYYSNLGSLYIANGTPDKAIEYLDKASSISDHNDMNKWNKSLALLEKGEYEKGFNDYDFGERNIKNESRNYGIENLPVWDGSPNKTVVVYGEQGIGDEIMFSSVIPDLMKTCTVIIDAHPRLTKLFRENFPGVAVYGTRKKTSKDIYWTKHHRIDAKIAIGSLCKWYRKKETDFPRLPYLKANPEFIKKYAEKLNELGELPKIGISWRGGTKLTHQENRYIPLENWIDLFEFEADFISLQYQPDSDQEVEKFKEKTGIHIHHWKDTLTDYDETAGLVANLDLIISVPQSVVHLAGAMGKPVIQLTPKRSMWQMGVYGKNMPWYGCVQSYWQENFDDWKPVLKRAKETLCNLSANNTEN